MYCDDRFVDSQHTCCNTIRDEKGICCLSGYLDECYVCDGDGISCATNVTMFVNFDANLTITYEVEEKWKFLIFILLTNVSCFTSSYDNMYNVILALMHRHA